MQGDIQCNYMDLIYIPAFLFCLPSVLSFFFLHLLFLLSFFSSPFLTPPSLTWEPDEALMESTGSQHLPHLKRTGRSLLLSAPLRAFPSLSFTPCFPLLPPFPRSFFRRTLHRLPRRGTLSRARVFFCLPLMCGDVRQPPFFCQGTSKTTDLDGDNSSHHVVCGGMYALFPHPLHQHRQTPVAVRKG